MRIEFLNLVLEKFSNIRVYKVMLNIDHVTIDQSTCLPEPLLPDNETFLRPQEGQFELNWEVLQTVLASDNLSVQRQKIFFSQPSCPSQSQDLMIFRVKSLSSLSQVQGEDSLFLQNFALGRVAALSQNSGEKIADLYFDRLFHGESRNESRFAFLLEHWSL